MGGAMVNRLCLTAVALTLVATGTLVADENSNGGTAGAMRRMGYSARELGMGMCAVAMPMGAESKQYNPALMAWTEDIQVGLDYFKLSLDRSMMGVHAVIPMKPAGALGASWTRAGVDEIPEVTSWGEPTGRNMSYSEHLFSFGAALHPARPVAFGVTVNIGTATFADLGEGDLAETATGLDAGISIHPRRNLWLGVALRNVGSYYEWDSSSIWDTDGETQVKNSLPTTFAAGFGVSLFDESLNLLADYEATNEDAWDIRLGGEYILHDLGGRGEAAFRAGYNDGSITAGAGFVWPLEKIGLGLDYAVVFHENDPEEIHVLSWSFLF